MNECQLRWEELYEQLLTIWDILEVDMDHQEEILQRCCKKSPSAVAKVIRPIKKKKKKKKNFLVD